MASTVTLPAEAGPVSSRGQLTVSARTIEKIASQVALELPLIDGRAGGPLGRGRPEKGARPKVTAELSGNVVVLQVELGVAFPAPIRRIVRQTQQQLSERVGRLAGVRVARVDVDVAWLSVAEPAGRFDELVAS